MKIEGEDGTNYCSYGQCGLISEVVFFTAVKSEQAASFLFVLVPYFCV